jgi:hypothetical protein
LREAFLLNCIVGVEECDLAPPKLRKGDAQPKTKRITEAGSTILFVLQYSKQAIVREGQK